MDILAADRFDRAMRAYITTMRIREDPEWLVTVRWYKCPPGAKPFPGPHCFGSTVWDADKLTFPAAGLGELTYKGTYDPGLPPLGICGCDTPTPLAWFLTGVPAGITGPYPHGRCETRGELALLSFGISLDAPMSTAIIPSAGLRVLLYSLRECLNGWRVLLFVNNVFPGPDTTVSSLHEASFPGYDRQSPVFTTTVLNPDGTARATSAPLAWVRDSGAGTQTVYGWAVLDPFSTALVAAGRFETPVTLSLPGQEVLLQALQVTLCRCPETGYKMIGTIAAGVASAGSVRTSYRVIGHVGLGLAASGFPPLPGYLIEAYGISCIDAQLPSSYTPFGALYLSDDQWFELDANVTDQYYVEAYCSGGSPPVEVYTGDCAALVSVGALYGPGVVTFHLDAGTSAFVRVPGYSSGSGEYVMALRWDRGWPPEGPRWIGAVGLGSAVASAGTRITIPGQIGAGAAPAKKLPQSTHSLHFASDYVALPSSSALNFQDGYTLALWLKLDDNSADQVFVERADSGNIYAPAGLALKYAAGTQIQLVHNYNDATQCVAYYYTTLPAGTWFHLAVTVDTTSNTVVFYYNGTANATSFTAGPYVANINGTPVCGIGNGVFFFFSTQQLLGRADDVVMIPTVLTGSQIADLAAGTLDPATLDFTAGGGLWRFEEGTGTTTADSSGHGNTGSFGTGVTWSTDVPSELQ